MKNPFSFLLAILISPGFGLIPFAAQGATALDVTLGPEVDVGKTITDDPSQQYQSNLRVDPINPDRMVITIKNSNNETRTAAFHTLDGGLTWGVNQQSGSGDPDIVYDRNGTAFWTIININDSNKPAVLISKNGGETWEGRVKMDGLAIDHAHSVVDLSPTSLYYNTVYLAGRDFNSATLGVVRSNNGGTSWTASTRSLSGTAGRGFVNQPWVMRNGTLVIPIKAQNNILVENGSYAGNLVNTYSVRSTDGGKTFDAPVFIANRDSPKSAGPGGGLGRADAGIVGGMWNGVERLYFAYPQSLGNGEPTQIRLSTSDDAGQSWSPARKISPDPPAGRGYSIPSIMVNPDGIVGLQYFEISGSDFNVYFSASSDGGETFSPPVRVSSATGKEVPFSQIPRELGGDQIFASAAADGTFRLVWTDNRDQDNFYKIYHRKVTVKPTDPGAGNQSPVSLSLIGGNAPGNSPVGASVGTLRSSDPDAGDSHTYSLVGGDVAKFRVNGNILETAAILDHSLVKSHTLTVRSTDSGGLFVERSIDIAVHPPLPIATAVDQFGSIFFGDDYQGDSSQDGANSSTSAVEVATARRSARITGNAWKRFPISYAVTNRTILEFTVNAPDTGEILGIILDDETAATVGRRGILVGGANVDGTAHSAWSWTVAAPTRYQAGSGPKNYSIPVGTFFTGQVNYVVLVGNDDADEGSTDATFSNIQLHEGTAPKTYSDWKAGITWGSIPENQRNETDDPDGDGRNNATERAFGGNPAASDTDSGSGIESSKNPDGSRILKVLYRKGVREMNYVLQQSTTLSTWADVTGSSESYDGSKGYHFRTWTAPANQTRGFTRIKATDAQ